MLSICAVGLPTTDSFLALVKLDCRLVFTPCLLLCFALLCNHRQKCRQIHFKYAFSYNSKYIFSNCTYYLGIHLLCVQLKTMTNK